MISYSTVHILTKARLPILSFCQNKEDEPIARGTTSLHRTLTDTAFAGTLPVPFIRTCIPCRCNRRHLSQPCRIVIRFGALLRSHLPSVSAGSLSAAAESSAGILSVRLAADVLSSSPLFSEGKYPVNISHSLKGTYLFPLICGSLPVVFRLAQSMPLVKPDRRWFSR